MANSSPSHDQTRCLIVENDDGIADFVRYVLQQDGFAVEHAPSGEMAISLCNEHDPNLVILDLDLPGMNGHDTAHELRRISDGYILMLSDDGTTSDRLSAVSSSIDDFVAKPFSRDELIARVHALLRRPHKIAPKTRAVTRVVVNKLGHSITIDDRPLTLTTLEFDLLARLAVSMPDTVTKAELIAFAWGNPDAATSHILNVHIHNLRHKLADVDRDIVIISVRAVGFRLLDRKPRVS